MKITKSELKTYSLEAFCDCGGSLIRQPIVLACSPPLFPHKCDKCQNVENLDRRYPDIEYERIRI